MRNCVILAVAALTLLASSAYAQTSFPNKPVRLVIAFTPGGSSDIIGRAVAGKLSEAWGQPVLVLNRPGAGATLGSKVVADSYPDGYTLLVSSSAHVANPGIFAKMPYDTLRDFTNLALLAEGPNALLVGTAIGWRALGDLIREAKANPGKLSFASAGIGSATHFNLEKFKIATGIDVVHVPYRGAPEAVLDTIAGRTCCYWAPLTAALPHINSGKAVAIAVSSVNRSNMLPDVPTVAEQGYPDFVYSGWVGLWGPANMSADVAARINRDVNMALASPDVSERIAKLGNEPGRMSLAQFDAFVRKELVETQEILRAAGVKPE